MTARENIEIALAIETLVYHDKNYLDSTLCHSDARINEEIRRLLNNALIELKK